MCLLFSISHVTVSQSNVQTQAELFRVEMCLGLFSVEEWSTFGVLVWSGYVSVVHLFSFSPESFSDLIFFPPLLPVITLFRFHASPVASHFSNSAESRLRSPAASLTTRRRSRLASKRCSTQTLWMSALVTEQMATLLQSINPRVGFTENINVR